MTEIEVKFESDMKFFEQSLGFSIEKTSVYQRINGAQFFSSGDFGITLEQFFVLEVLAYTNNVCQRDISKRILKDRSNTSRILNVLEEKGFIKRKVDTKQNRLVKIVSLTKKGEKLLEELLPKIKQSYFKSLEDITEEEIAIVKKVLKKMRDNLSKNTTIQI